MSLPIDASEVTWEELKERIYDEDGSWRDIYVLNASRADWKKWVEFGNTNYRLAFSDGNDGRHELIDFAAVEIFWDSHGQASELTSTFWVGEIRFNCHFFVDEEIENDIDPSEIDSYAAHLQLMDYMTRFSRFLGKEVILTGENDSPCRVSGIWQSTSLIATNGSSVYVHPYWRNMGFRLGA